jgi:hypothetical protein
VSVADNANINLNGTPFTLECWAKVDDVAAIYAFLDKNAGAASVGGSGQFGWRFICVTGGSVWLQIVNNGVFVTGAGSGIVTMAPGAFYHLVYTHDGTNGVMWVNGSLIQTRVHTAPAATAASALLIGGGSFVTEGTKGVVDEAAIYRYVLTPQQIANHYALRTSTIATVAAATALDSAPTPHNGVVNGGVVLQQVGALADGNTAAHFDGTGTIDINPSNIGSLSAVTMECWLNPDSLTIPAASGFQLMWNFSVAGGSDYFAKRASGNLMCSMNIGGLQKTLLAGAGVLTVGQWAHAVATYDGAALTLYVNGVQKAQTTGLSGAANFGTGNIMSIGRDRTGDEVSGQWWIGLLDECALYPTALTARQVAEHYGLRLAVLSGLKASGAAAIRNGSALVGSGGVKVSGAATYRKGAGVVGTGGARVSGAGNPGHSVGVGVRAAERFAIVPVEPRIVSVAAEPRIVSVPIEPRTVAVPLEVA